MANLEIVNGLKYALQKGESLKRAMMTFFNAGYKKEEIEEAARHLSEPIVEPESEEEPQPTITQKQKNIPQPSRQKVSAYDQSSVAQKKTAQISPKTIEKKSPPQILHTRQQPAQKISTYGKPSITNPPQPVQKISTYEKEKKKGKAIIIILILLLLILIGALISIFVFKKQIVDFFSNLFS